MKGQVPHTKHPQLLRVALTTLPNKGSFVTVFPDCQLFRNTHHVILGATQLTTETNYTKTYESASNSLTSNGNCKT